MEYLKPYLQVFEDYLNQNRFDQLPSSLYSPLNYILDLGGKRVRPCLAIMAYDLYKDQLDPVLPVAYAVELFHNFSLMHDDIMDEAEMRRGELAVHKKYDRDSAILSGDLMLIKAYEYLEFVDDRYYKTAMKIFNKAAIEVCEGQRLDMDFEKRKEVNISEYLHMITYKTSVLLAASLELGALIGGASENDQRHIYEFGKNIGIAFQIQDDILDVFGGEEVGKRIGGDIVQNKKTYLYLKALELASDDQRVTLEAYYSAGSEIEETRKITEVTSMFKSLLVKEYASQVMEAYKDLAISHIVQMSIPEENKSDLKSFAEYLIQRLL
jgi:geranylgeranyl diphosphate synthase type II